MDGGGWRGNELRGLAVWMEVYLLLFLLRITIVLPSFKDNNILTDIRRTHRSHADASPASVIGVLGAGTMGAGIAQLACRAGARTLLHDPLAEALQRGARAHGTAWPRSGEGPAQRRGGGRGRARLEPWRPWRRSRPASW